jgi:hypothetical protein
MTTAAAPFPFTAMFQNGPRRQAFAPQNLFKPGKDFPPPRTNRRALAGSGPFRRLTYEKRKGADAKAKSFRACGRLPPPVGRNRGAEILAGNLPKSQNPCTAC